MEVSLTPESVVVFIAFVIVIVLLYKVFKFVTRALIISTLSFFFPWIVKFLNLPIQVSADIETGVKFMLLGLAIFIIYEFSSTIIAILRLVLKLIKWIFRRRRREVY
jgi:hypothetical protein